MATQDAPPSGPDLRSGVPLSTLTDGIPLLGHVDGEPVMLVRRGDEMFAVGAACTHYGVSLADGLVVGDTVRCPAHHACFALRTGEAVRAPALEPVASWEVERRGDRVLVMRKRTPPAPAREAHRTPSDLSSVVILGAGAAGGAAAEMLRRMGFEGRVTMVGAESATPYDRPNLSKDYLAGTAPEEWIPLRDEAFYREQGIDLVLGARATKIDPARREVKLVDGRTLAWDALLLATGADPTRLPVPTHRLSHVHYLRTLADSRAIIARAGQARRAVVVGGSFIALEVAASLRTRGLDVHVVAPASHLLDRQLGPELGDMVRAIHEERGVVFHLGESVGAIDEQAVTLRSGRALPADLVVAGIGVRPSVALAMWAGLALDQGSVVVDEHLRTSAPGIYAAGDITRWPDPRSGARIRSEHWVVAQRQGQVAARNMLGAGERFDAVPFFWSSHYDVAVRYVGHAEQWDRVRVAGSLERRDAAVAFEQRGRTLAVATVGRDLAALRAEEALERMAWSELDGLMD